MITISARKQQLEINVQGFCKRYPVATAANGLGEAENSFCTPRGVHRICQKIGEGDPINSVFIGRVATGEVYSKELAQKYPDRDWILTRILWLEGIEDNNRSTKQRYIYIHGSPPQCIESGPNSKGCIQMLGEDIIELFSHVKTGTLVTIYDHETSH